MTRKNDKVSEGDLERLFQQARDQAPAPSDRLIDAILRDAEAALQQATRTAPVSAPPLAGWASRLLEAVGGWRSVAALAVSACFGLWIGYAVPDTAGLLSGDFSTANEVSDVDYTLYSDIDELLTEG